MIILKENETIRGWQDSSNKGKENNRCKKKKESIKDI